MYTKLMICGSRTITDREWVFKQIDEYLSLLVTSGRVKNTVEELEVIHGGASGVDNIADEWAKMNGYRTTVIRPDWEKLGKKAGILRNKTMVDMADRVLILWDGISKGTKSDIDFATKAQKNPYIKKYSKN